VNGRDDGRGCVEGIEGSALGTVVFLRREQRFQLFTQSLPSGILVAAGGWVREDGESDRPKSREAGEYLLLLRRGRTMFLLDYLDGADRGENVACFGFFAAGDGRG
jgi:hypothetical protein